MASFRRSILFRLACDPVCRLWSGFGDLDITDAVDPGGATYLGAGALLDVPVLKQLINGVADRIDFGISGVPDRALRLVLEDAPSVQDAPLLIGEQSFDRGWQVNGAPAWLWRGYADVLSVESAESEQGRQRTIRLSVRSADTFRANPVTTYFTDQDQRRQSPDDAIFSHVGLISAGAKRKFGPGS